MNLAAYTDASLAEIAEAHAFVDGNKRTAFVTALAFLRLNGYSFRPPPVEGVKMMEDLTSGQVSETEFARWLSSGITPI